MGKIKELKKRIEEAREEKIKYVKEQNFGKAVEMRDHEKDLMEELEQLKKLKASKLINKTKRKQIEQAILEVAWHDNSSENRAKLSANISEILGFEIQDITTAGLVDKGFVCLRGYDKNSERVIDIVISPSMI
jgi:hypothetical protein